MILSNVPPPTSNPTAHRGLLWDEWLFSNPPGPSGLPRKAHGSYSPEKRNAKMKHGMSGTPRSTSWAQISHYLPHKPPWFEAKVSEAEEHSWTQRLRHPSGKWPAFDQACQFCLKGDPAIRAHQAASAAGHGHNDGEQSHFPPTKKKKNKTPRCLVLQKINCHPHTHPHTHIYKSVILPCTLTISFFLPIGKSFSVWLSLWLS